MPKSFPDRIAAAIAVMALAVVVSAAQAPALQRVYVGTYAAAAGLPTPVKAFIKPRSTPQLNN